MSADMSEALSTIPPERIPRHIAIIMDGNGRWAAQRGLPRMAGHQQGVTNLREVINACLEFGIKYLTVFAFSTENWGRPEYELKGLKQIFLDTFQKEFQEISKHGVKILHIGQREGLGDDILNCIDYAVENSKNNSDLVFTVAINYGSRNEIKHAVKKIIADGIQEDQISEELIGSYLFTNGVPDPDMVVRTSGEMRLSNFLLWQSAYSEWVFSKTYWPDYGRGELLKSIQEYAGRDRRFGKLTSQ